MCSWPIWEKKFIVVDPGSETNRNPWPVLASVVIVTSIVAAFSASSVDPLLGNAILRELAEEPVTNPAATRARIEATGRNWDDVVKDASYVLGKTAGRLRPEQLSARSLVMLAVHGDMMRRHLVGRPTAKK